MRRHFKYRIPVVQSGFRGPVSVRGLHPSGFEEVRVNNPKDVDDVDPKTQAIRIARTKNLKISISGKKHSQGGHAFYDNAVLLDMTHFNQILDLDVGKKIITVQSGVTWEQIQEYINPHNLSIKTMQSSNTVSYTHLTLPTILLV